MKCDHVEELLPLYLDGGLDGGELADVRAHVDGCPRCREALSFFEKLEGSLARRKRLVPPAAHTIARVLPRVEFGARRPVWRAVFSFPGMLSAAFVMAGVFLVLLGNPLQPLMDRVSQVSVDAAPLVDGLGRSLEALGYNWIVLTIIASLLFLLIMLSGSWMVLRFARD